MTKYSNINAVNFIPENVSTSEHIQGYMDNNFKSDMVTHELRVESLKARVEIQIHELRVQIHELRVRIHEFKNH